jgi:anti-sigma factor RsiW
MKHEMELKVQAWLDGETSDRKAARLADWIARDAEAGALAAELGSVRKAMVDNELTVPLPETREFHWSKIERQIQREALAPRRASVSWSARFRHFLLPLTGAAALVFALTVGVKQMHQPAFDEISATDEGMDAVTFHDQSAEMTVVWLQNDSQTSGAAQQPAKNSAPADANSDTETE